MSKHNIKKDFQGNKTFLYNIKMFDRCYYEFDKVHIICNTE